MTKPKQTPATPKGLSPGSARLWRGVHDDFEIVDSAGRKILEIGLRALDRAESCRKQIDETGETVLDRFQQLKPNPLLAPERDARSQFLIAMKSLCLDVEGR